jgi:hypothetical protein
MKNFMLIMVIVWLIFALISENLHAWIIMNIWCVGTFLKEN